MPEVCEGIIHQVRPCHRRLPLAMPIRHTRPIATSHSSREETWMIQVGSERALAGSAKPSVQKPSGLREAACKCMGTHTSMHTHIRAHTHVQMVLRAASHGATGSNDEEWRATLLRAQVANAAEVRRVLAEVATR